MRFLSLLLVVAVVTPTLARKWTDLSGKYSVEAEYVGHEAGAVILKQKDGKVLRVPLSKLSKANQAFIRAKLGATKTSKAQGGKASKKTLEQRLAEKTDFEFEKAALQDILNKLGKKHGVPMYIDRNALDSIGISAKTPVSLKSKAGSLRANLQALAAATKMTWLVRDDVVFWTSPVAAEASLQTRVYKLRNPGATDRLVKTITRQVAPKSWEGVGGAGSIMGYGPCLIVSQVREAHDLIVQGFKKELTLVKQPTPKAKPKTPMARALHSSVPAEFVDTPLKDVVTFFGQMVKAKGVELLLDVEALENVGLGPDTPVSLSVSNIPLKSALNLLTHSLNLSWKVTGKKIEVTTREKSAQSLVATDYDVQLIMLTPVDVDSLIEMLTTIVEPEAWEEVGGPGSVNFKRPGNLAIKQTREVHDQILQLVTLLESVLKPAK